MSKPTRYGASADAWDHFAYIAGWAERLLPVVADPNVPISPNSKLKSIGKTPSVINSNGHVTGIPRWTEKKTSPKEITRWRQDGRLSTCVRTGNLGLPLTESLIAVDIDVTDEETAKAIATWLEAKFGESLQWRTRSNTGKRLALIRVPIGDFRKRVLRVADPGAESGRGVIEILGEGQQCLLAGTHTSGVPYVWEGGWPTIVPLIDAPLWEEAWGGLVETFGHGGGDPVLLYSPGGQAGLRRASDAQDPVVPLLWMHGVALSEDAQGRVLVRCPWEDEHSAGEAGDSSTVYLPAGVGGIGVGRFRCLHASCADKDTADFIRGVGIEDDVFDARADEILAQFDVVESEDQGLGEKGQRPDHRKPGSKARPLPTGNFRRNKQGQILPTHHAYLLAVTRPAIVRVKLRYDQLRDRIQVANMTDDGFGPWRTLQDDDVVGICGRLTSPDVGFSTVAKSEVHSVVVMAARTYFAENELHDYLAGLEWDGVERVDSFLSEFAQAEDTPYARAVSAYTWTALLGRALQPGIKADMLPVLQGPQGSRKSTLAELLSPFPGTFARVSLGHEELETLVAGMLVAEVDELRGLQTRDAEHLKSVISSTHATYRPKYGREAVTKARSCLFIGTTNEHQFLSDFTGNRRWLPVAVGAIDTERFLALRDQFWAEAHVRYLINGIEWQAAEKHGDEGRERFVVEDQFATAILGWLRTPAFGDASDGSVEEVTVAQAGRGDGWTLEEIVDGALGRTARRSDWLHVSKALRGFPLCMDRRKMRMHGGAPHWRYVLTDKSRI